MNFPRSSGILLHPTSLPGPYGVGDLGPEAHKFAVFLESAGQSLWQVLPLGSTGYGDSPYACYSAFAGNPLLISPDLLEAEGLMSPNSVEVQSSENGARIDFAQAHAQKDEVLRNAFRAFKQSPSPELQNAFETFISQNSSWLDDYALFRALKDSHAGMAWNEWETDLANRVPVALQHAREQLRDEIDAQRFYQFIFFRQLLDLRNTCHTRGIKLVGDLPIFMAHDSVDVWVNPDLFRLDKDGNPTVVAGVPPDYFSKTGQLWGNPVYDWDRMQADGFRWWIERVRATLRMVDIVRLDHFRGFAACWEIPAGEPTAENGQWVKAPGKELLTAIRNELGELPLIAEDLGVITPDVVALRDDFGFPGMRVLQFGFGDQDSINLPHNYLPNIVAYTGTHDNDTTIGWFSSAAPADTAFCLKYINSNGQEFHWDFIRAVWASVANTSIVPLQDLLGLGAEARMNLPNTTAGNWGWRFTAGDLTSDLATRLKELTTLYGRIH